MKLAIMQPYFFPYIGYFQLINAVDKFVFYDDVNFIKQGWINRNNILVNNNKHLFAFPIEKISSFKSIAETKINKNLFEKKKQKFFKTIKISYKKAPYYREISGLVFSTLNQNSEYISDYAKESIVSVLKYLNIETKIIISSTIYKNNYLNSTKRVLDICQKENAKIYINPSGGKKIYSDLEFNKNSIELKFLKTGDIKYKQLENEFVPNLSIIDLMMFNSKNEIKKMLNNYELI